MLFLLEFFSNCILYFCVVLIYFVLFLFYFFQTAVLYFRVSDFLIGIFPNCISYFCVFDSYSNIFQAALKIPTQTLFPQKNICNFLLTTISSLPFQIFCLLFITFLFFISPDEYHDDDDEEDDINAMVVVISITIMTDD